jgi:diguanylate cyclase (GGDEF)-like protein/PAS domain S-box-containing protein
VIDKEGCVTYASPSYRNLLGAHYQHIIGQKLTFGLFEEDKKMLEDSLKRIYGNGVSIRMEYRYLNEKATPVWVEVNATSIAGEREMDHVVLTGRIISERKQLQEQLIYQAYHDSLTGLPNRRLLEQELKAAIEKAEAYTGKLALLFLDCDNFKEINDTYGHDIGDELLAELSQRLVACVRSEDIVARMGGDEFVILLNQVEDQEHIMMVANRIQKSLQQPYLLDNREIEATSSIGISIYPENGTSTKELFRKADQALYHVKNNGRNDYQLYS